MPFGKFDHYGRSHLIGPAATAATLAYTQGRDYINNLMGRYARRGPRTRTASRFKRKYGSKTTTRSKKRRSRYSRLGSRKTRFSTRRRTPLHLKIARLLAGSKTIMSSQTARIDAAQGYQEAKSFIFCQINDNHYNGERSLDTWFKHFIDAGGMDQEDKVHVNWAKMVYTMTNESNLQINVKVLDLLCRRRAANATNPDDVVLPESAMKDALRREDPSDLETTPWVENPGFEASKNSMFHKFWKVENRTHKVLNPGEVYRHNVFHRLNRTILGTDVCIRGELDFVKEYFTRATLIIIYGTPINSGAVHSTIGYSAASLNVICRSEMSCTLISTSHNERKFVTTQGTPSKTIVDGEAFDILGDLVNPAVN